LSTHAHRQTRERALVIYAHHIEVNVTDAQSPMIITHTLENGLSIALEPLQTVASAAAHLLIPGGGAHDDDAHDGCAVLLHEMMLRGTNALNSKELTSALDAAGMQRGGGPGRCAIRLSSATTAPNLDRSLELMLQIACNPRLDPQELEPARTLCMQSLEHLQDDPEDEAGRGVLYQHLNRPFHRTRLGSRTGLQSVTIEELQARHRDCVRPGGAVLAISGRFDPRHVIKVIERHTEAWSGSPPPSQPESPGPRGQCLIARDTAQVHLAMAWDAACATHPDAATERLLCTAVGGTTSGRLFTEVRQRASLCYSIGARYAAAAFGGWCTLRSGTTPDNAVRLIETIEGVFQAVSNGIRDDELRRARRTCISSLVLQGESTLARAGRLAADLHERGSCRTLDETIGELNAVTLDDVNRVAARYGSMTPTMVAIGPAGVLPWEAPDHLWY